MREPDALPIPGPPPLLALLEVPETSTGDTDTDEDPTRPDRGRKLVCRRCRAVITSASARIERHGKHRHVFANPAGYLYELGCFSQAPGCSREGAPSWEFTWFAGHSWQIQVCRSCNALMGWEFRTPSGEGFYGLILPHLEEEDDDA